MSAYALVCLDGSVTLTVDGAPLCSGSWTLSPVTEPFVVDEAAIVACSQAFGVGFALVITCFVAGWGIRTVLSLIR
ncbi:hypothetical protein D9M68_328020 [compost metagenome]